MPSRLLPALSILLLGGLLGPAAPAAGQGAAARVELRHPADDAVFGWGRDAPPVTLAAHLDLGGRRHVSDRLFLTANVLQNGQLVDSVRLWDDGSHGDEQAGDGVYTATYRPPAPGSYEARIRAQWDDAGGTRDGWSETAPFHVERVPYPHIVAPEPGGKIGRRVTARARILLDAEPFNERDETLRVEAWTAREGEAAGERTSGRRRGTVASIPVDFGQLGPAQLAVAVSVERRGQRLETVDGPLTVEVGRPPLAFFLLAGLFLLGALFTGRRRPLPLHRHQLRVRDRVNRQTRLTATVEATPGEPVRRTLGGSGADLVVEGARGTLCTLVAAPGEAALRAEAGDGGDLRAEGGRESAFTIRPAPGKAAFAVGELEVIYEDAVTHRLRRFPFWHPTPAKGMLLGLAAAAAALGAWQWGQFFRS